MVSYCILGVYFGWIDDVFVMLQLKGEVISPQNGFFNLRGNNYFSYFYVWLYNHFGKFNWYGIFLSFYSGLCILNINFILLHLISKTEQHVRKLFLFFSLAFFAAYVIENVYLINFTRIAILLTGTSIICAVITFKTYRGTAVGKRLFMFFALLFFIGWNCRLFAVLIFMPIILLFLFLIFEKKLRFIFPGGLAIFIGLYFCLAFLFLNDKNRAEYKSINHTEKYVHNILNAFNGVQIDELNNPRDSIKSLALYRWYFADRDTVLNQEFLDEIGSYNPLRVDVLKNWQKNLKQEITKARSFYGNNYMPDLNWYYKTVGFWIIVGALPFLFIFYHSVDFKRFLRSILLYGATLVFVLLVIIFFKMEDRAMAPLLIFTFFAVWMLLNETDKPLNIEVLKILIVVFIIVGGHRVQGYKNNSTQRGFDLDLKSKVRSNIDKFYNDKTVFFDLYSLTILETHPFWNVNFPDNWTSGLEMFNLHSIEHHQNIEKIVGCLDWPCFYQEVSKTPNKYMFFYSNERIRITHDYNKIIYNEEFYFRKESENMIINQLHYSFLWFPVGLGFFSLDTSLHNLDEPYYTDLTTNYHIPK
jgi:hypothetical protein